MNDTTTIFDAGQRLASQGLAEDGENDIHLHKPKSGVRIFAAVLRK